MIIKIEKILILVLMATITLFAYPQSVKKKNIPPEAKTKLNSMFPNVKDIEWIKNGRIYIAEFLVDKTPTSVLFNNIGEFQQLVQFININDLPKDAISYLNKFFKIKQIGDVSRIKDKNDQTTYLVEIKNIAIIFDENGKFLKMNK